MKKRVLLVDDSAAIVKQLQKILEDSGIFEVIGHSKKKRGGEKKKKKTYKQHTISIHITY